MLSSVRLPSLITEVWTEPENAFLFPCVFKVDRLQIIVVAKEKISVL